MATVGWDRLRSGLAARSPARVSDSVSARAAVAAILREGGAQGLEILFIRRAEHERDPWSGHVGFPGGRAEPGEKDLLDTVVRETAEETGIDLRREAECLGSLDEVKALARGRPVDLAITPFVFRLLRRLEGTPSPEVVSLHWLSFERLLEPGGQDTMEYRHGATTLQLPCLNLDGLVIWGLTYRMFENLRRVLLDAHAPDERRGSGIG